jgi:hypothetical protein
VSSWHLPGFWYGLVCICTWQAAAAYCTQFVCCCYMLAECAWLYNTAACTECTRLNQDLVQCLGVQGSFPVLASSNAWQDCPGISA